MSAGPASHAVSTLARCVVFAGGLRASPLQASCERSVLDLMIAPGRTVLEAALDRVGRAIPSRERATPVCVVYGEPVPRPVQPKDHDGLSVSVMAEVHRWRGPAGLLLDTCEDLAPDATILVLEGARWYGSALDAFVLAHLESDAPVTIAQTADGSPAGVYLIRRSALDKVPRLGFLDLKEQLFSKLVQDGQRIIVHTLDSTAVMPLRTLQNFLDAAADASGSAEPWCVVDPSAQVHPSATVVSSVIMPGAIVEAEAVVARSIVWEGARVRAGEVCVDRVVQQPGARGAGSRGDSAGRTARQPGGALRYRQAPSRKESR